MLRIARVGCFVVTTLVVGTVAQSSQAEPPSAASPDVPHVPHVAPVASGPARPAGQGVAVLAVGGASRDEAFALARAVYGSRLRPRSLDEVRARVLAGGDPPANASRELRELAEVRGAVTGDDAAGRRLLTGLAQQVGAHALLVVKVEPVAPAPPASPSAPLWPSFEAPSPPAGSDGTEPAAGASGPGSAAPGSMVVARLFLADAGEFDAARYFPEPGARGADAWKSTVTSLEGRFSEDARVARPPASTASIRLPPAAPLASESPKSEAFYTSAWFWGALGAAALVGGAFYFASRGDTSSDPIHLQMRVPK
jgi:hypothetical protein